MSDSISEYASDSESNEDPPKELSEDLGEWATNHQHKKIENPKVGICHFSGTIMAQFGLEFSLGMLHTFPRQIPTRKWPNP